MAGAGATVLEAGGAVFEPMPFVIGRGDIIGPSCFAPCIMEPCIMEPDPIMPAR